jgi:hypothetical protein
LFALIDPDGSSSDNSINSINNTKWEFRANVNPDVRLLNPYINRLSINELTASLNWQAKDIEEKETDPDFFYDSVSNFFYPDSYIFPSVSASLS